MSAHQDGPASSLFWVVPLERSKGRDELKKAAISDQMRAALDSAPIGACVSWGIPFQVDGAILLEEEAETVSVDLDPTTAEWVVFMHVSDIRPLETDRSGVISPMRGQGHLGEEAGRYSLLYRSGARETATIRRRFQIGAFQRIWGENCFEAVAHHKPFSVLAHHEQASSFWGRSQTRVSAADSGEWTYWLWAWENPRPGEEIASIDLEAVSGTILVAGLALGHASANPLRWERRRKAVLTLPDGVAFDGRLDEDGLLSQIRLDLGQVISATPRPVYPSSTWEDTHNNQVPDVSANQALVEYAAHPDARFHLQNGDRVPVSALGGAHSEVALKPVPPATQRVTLRVVEAESGRPVPVKLHVHGEEGEYLAPLDRHRIPNSAWFEDYSSDFVHLGQHFCTYIPGETRIDLPVGRVYVEVAKGFEIRPLRRVIEVTAATEEIVLEIEKVLPWRERGWVTADTHVHFLSPPTALLEGSAEGVNIVNLLASQWGELMTNVGDFDGRTTWGAKEAGGDGEYLVRVGTENRQHVMGHISLLGYSGSIIAPMTTGGPDESALGDPIGVLLTEWARQCHRQGGVVVLPHFPNPRAENAAALVHGDIDAVEMTSWGDLYSGINPYSLSDWYRYLNCGYMVAAVGGTDKMTASTAVGTVRTYARLPPSEELTYEAWKETIRRGETFVTYGPLLEFEVQGKPMGTRMHMSRSGGTVDVVWRVASVTLPMSRVELMVNGEIGESQEVGPEAGEGHWSVKVDQSSWLALLVRGHYPDRPEIIAAHSSPVMIEVDGSPFYAAADALTILEQIEGAIAYLDTVGTRAETQTYRRMRLILESAHRRVHNQMHAMGRFHKHTPLTDHAAHHP